MSPIFTISPKRRKQFNTNFNDQKNQKDLTEVDDRQLLKPGRNFCRQLMPTDDTPFFIHETDVLRLGLFMHRATARTHSHESRIQLITTLQGYNCGQKTHHCAQGDFINPNVGSTRIHGHEDTALTFEIKIIRIVSSVSERPR